MVAVDEAGGSRDFSAEVSFGGWTMFALDKIPNRKRERSPEHPENCCSE